MKHWGVFIVGIILTVTASAVPAYRGPITHKQSDGSLLSLYQHGDEYFHYFTNEAGQWLQEDDNGDYRIIPTLKNEDIAVRRATSPYAHQEPRRAPAASNATGIDRLLSPRGPVILVNFTDTKFSSSRAEMYDWAMGDDYSYNGATGSIHQYFQDVSYGKYNLQLDVFGPVTVSRNYAYYGKNSSSAEGSDSHPNELVVEACKLAVAEGADFSNYDDDNDGYVDWVVIIFAGKGEADGGGANTIWPHQYDLSYTGMAFKLNGKTVNHYCMLNELYGQTGKRAGIGVFVHEFSHIMGLPDLYVTNGSGKWKTLGMWDIMDYGPYNNDANTPPTYSAYERWFMGWLSPMHITDPATLILQDLNNKASAAYITENGEAVSNIVRPYPNTFYMLENRQKTKWDEYIPGHGLLITKINYKYNYWKYNQVNNTENAMGIDLLEADGVTPKYDVRNRNNGYFGKETDAYPTGSNTFTQVSEYQITDIEERGRHVIFNVNGGGEPVIVEALRQLQAPKADGIKWLRNGQIIIRSGDQLYDLNGKRIY